MRPSLHAGDLRPALQAFAVRAFRLVHPLGLLCNVAVFVAQAALTAAQAQVAELQDVKDVTGAAVASLEATLARVEKAATATAASGAGGGVPRPGSALAGGARRVSLTG